MYDDVLKVVKPKQESLKQAIERKEAAEVDLA